MNSDLLRRRWGVLAALTFARAAMGFQFQSIAAVSPFLGQELSIDNAELGWLIGLYLLPGIVVALPGGLMAARFGDKRLTLVGLAMMACGGALVDVAGTFAIASVGRMLSGAGAVILNVVLTKMVTDAFDTKERLLAMSVLINAWPIGIGLALMLTGPLAELGPRAAVAASAAFAVAGLIAVAVAVRSAGNVAPASAGIGIGAINRGEWRLLVSASLPWLLFNAAYQIVVSFVPAFFVEAGMTIGRAGGIVGLNTLLIIVSVQAGGVILKRARHPDLICVAAIVVWCISLVMLSTGSMPLLWIIVGGLVAGLSASAFVTLPSEFLRPESRGAGMGVFYTVYYLGCAILPGVAGALYDVAHSAASTLWLAAAIAFLSIVALGIFRREQQHVAPRA